MATLPAWARKRRSEWRWIGAGRPSFASPGDEALESVWDYPRPPRVEADSRRVVVRAGGSVLAESRRACRVLETASPPTFYLPAGDVATEWLEAGPGESRCEWKGVAKYWDVAAPAGRLPACAWSYPDPFAEFTSIQGYFSFYPARLECFVDEVRVEPQPGGFYGGWVTPELAGPFKGEPGSENW